MGTFIVRSTHGNICADADSGKVLVQLSNYDGNELKNITRIDVREYRRWAAKSDQPSWQYDTETDILLVGYWIGNRYIEAEEEARDALIAESLFGSSQTCKNPEMHAKFADRGIEDQCPHCVRNLAEMEYGP